MTIMAPDRTDRVRDKTVRTIERGKTTQFLVVADADGGRATVAHLIELGPQNEMATALPRIEAFSTEAEARAAFSQVSEELTPQERN